jgi:hypothetical protein
MAAHHDTHEHPQQPAPAFRKTQAFLVIGVFACIVAAFVLPGLYVTAGAMLAACVLIGVAAKMQPAPPAEEHH